MKISRLAIQALFLLSLWLGLGLQAQAQTDTVTYVYTDPQGTPLVEADAQGNIVARYDYTPYGNAVASLGNPPNGPGYTGHVNDLETGLVYMQARYYDPAVGRFLSVDPVTPAAGNAFNFSRYAYANNNPIANVDPDGRQEEDGGEVAEEFYQARQENFLRPMAPVQQLDPVMSELNAVHDAKLLNEIIAPGSEAKAFNDAVNKILIVTEKIPNSDLKEPPAKRGNAPTGNDGSPVELHHKGQQPDSPVVEMTRTEHRGEGNFKKNHQNTGQRPSEIDRKEWKRQQRQYWRDQWDGGRFHGY